MAYVVCQPCIGNKYAACITVCPFDAIHPKPHTRDWPHQPQVYIDPNACTDCSACESMCPVTAIFSEFDIPDGWWRYVAINADYYAE